MSLTATRAQLTLIFEYLLENRQVDARYLGTHYLSGCQWFGAYVASQSLESLQISFAFDLCDLTLSRKRIASSEPAYRPAKEPFQESMYWTDTSNQSLQRHAASASEDKGMDQSESEKRAKTSAPTIPTTATATTSVTAIATATEQTVPNEPEANEIPTVPSYMRPTAVVVTCRTPRLTDSGMAEFIQNSSPDVSLSQADREFEEDIAPSMDVIRELEQEEAERERQLILDSQTRREVEADHHQNQSRSTQSQIAEQIREAMATSVTLEMEADIREHGFYESPLQNRRSAMGPSKYKTIVIILTLWFS